MLGSSSNLLMVLHREACVSTEDGGSITLRKQTLPTSEPGAALVLRRLVNGGLTAEQFDAAFCDEGGGDFIACMIFRRRLAEAGFLDYSLMVDGCVMARLTWLVGGEPFEECPVDWTQAQRLSRYTCIRRLDDRLIVESPLGRARIELAPEVSTLLAPLFAGTSLSMMSAACPQFGERGSELFLKLMHNARALVSSEVNMEENPAEDKAPLGWWEYYDLLFHSRSRLGRHSLPYGGTFHRRGCDTPLPLLRHEVADAGQTFELFKPDLGSRVQADLPFGTVMESRRSIREYGDEPLTVEQLGEFLFRTARVQKVIPTGPDDLDYSYRPHPAGGAIHELTIYPVIGACRGLARGLYRYDPVRHALTSIPAPDADLDRLLELAWITADRRSSPQVYFAITAWFARLQWKYQSIVYAVILKNVGALYQTMYLNATAMGLAPCALGGGDSEFFARTAGLDSLAETTVGEFMLGSRAVPRE